MEVVHAIYQDVPGAEFDTEWGEYTLPCDSKINVSVLVGYVLDPLTKTEAMIYSNKIHSGKEIPIHPIDTVILADPGETSRTDRNSSLCVGAFGAIGEFYTGKQRPFSFGIVHVC